MNRNDDVPSSQDTYEELSEEERESMRESLANIRQEVEKSREENRPKYLAQLRKQGGDFVDVLIQSAEETLKAIHSTDPVHRRISLHLALYYWEFHEEIVGDCESLAFTDPDEQVRRVAIKGLGLLYKSTEDARIGKLLAGIIKSSELPEQLRLIAYGSLVHLDGKWKHNVRLLSLTLDTFDWDLIKKYATDSHEEGG